MKNSIYLSLIILFSSCSKEAIVPNRDPKAKETFQDLSKDVSRTTIRCTVYDGLGNPIDSDGMKCTPLDESTCAETTSCESIDIIAFGSVINSPLTPTQINYAATALANNWQQRGIINQGQYTTTKNDAKMVLNGQSPH